VRAGDLVCFAGTLDHLSLANRTGAARHTFQLHLVEGPAAGVAWAKGNWMQYPAGLDFPSLSLG
jgi:phytanoyl-CoA hydroxylase